MPEAGDIAAMIALLASPQTARITGQAIGVNSGISAAWLPDSIFKQLGQKSAFPRRVAPELLLKSFAQWRAWALPQGGAGATGPNRVHR
jgi:hypothetical protein